MNSETTAQYSGDDCLFCENNYQNSELIEIYSKESLEKDIPEKIESCLSVKLPDFNRLQLKCCFECISTIIHWHNFLQNALRTLKKLNDQENSLENGNDEQKLGLINSVESKVSYQSKDKNCTSKRNRTNNDENIGEIKHFSEDVYTEEDEPEIKKNVKSENIGECCVCYICSGIFSSEDEMLNHTNEVHSDPVESGISEGRTSESKQQLRVKIDQKIINEAKIVVDDKVYYNCKQCGKNLLSPYSYIWHLRIHTGERPFVCDLCGKQFRVSQGLSRHIKETHARIKNFSCNICDKTFVNKRNVDDHKRIHTNERPYVCAMCGKAFKQKASLYVHNRTHTDFFPVKCEYCNQKFRTKPCLMTHITKHTGLKPYSCDVCERSFRIKYELKRHKLVHSEEKPFACSMCGLRFKQKRYLRNHFRSYHSSVNIVPSE